MNNENSIEPIKNESKTFIRSVSLSSQLEVPQFTERVNPKGWVDFGRDNDYPSYLIGLSNRSARHSAILKKKANMVGGQGWMKGNLSPQAITFLKNPNNKHTLDDILARISYDYELSGGFFLNIVWSKDRKTIAEINYIPWDRVRVTPTGGTLVSSVEYDGYWVCDDWKNWRKHTPVFYSPFSSEDREEANQILYVKQYQASNNYYAVPNWIACSNYCELDYELSLFHLNEVKRGFHPTLIINFNQQPSEEEADKYIKKLRQEYEGAEGQKTLFTFSDGKDNAPVITPIDLNETDQKYKDIEATIENNIFQAHQINNPALFGVKTPGQIGGSNEILESLSIFQATYIVHQQKAIENVFNKLANINGIEDNLFIERYNLNLEVKLEAQDILLILQSTITNEQKVQVFEAMGYTRQQALALCPSDAPIAPQPTKLPTGEIQP